MLGVLWTRPKPWILNSKTSGIRRFSVHRYHQRITPSSPIQFVKWPEQPRRFHSRSCDIRGCGSGGGGGGVASIWHLIGPSRFEDNHRRIAVCSEWKGEGSWNVACDARPARWLQRPDSAWFLFGVCSCLLNFDSVDGNSEELACDMMIDCGNSNDSNSDKKIEHSAYYKVTGVSADGRCLFRALAHSACLRKGEEPPDEDSERELADELRSQVVEELLKRRKETEWYIEDDFDKYVERLREPYTWGGEPELLMASHVLKTKISVFMKNRGSDELANIANYGEEYRKEKERPISVLFHGYGHYDMLEI